MKTKVIISKNISIKIEQDLLNVLRNVNSVKDNPFKGRCNSIYLNRSVNDILDLMKETIVHSGKSANLMYNEIEIEFK
ncbi:hypothetical protein [Proteus mirabilis]|uniref:hypothetical protein n=1 Tax=Proteus mirabilis TaxID=584 RepID=UPI0034D41642